jgi:hypothetical protein
VGLSMKWGQKKTAYPSAVQTKTELVEEPEVRNQSRKRVVSTCLPIGLNAGAESLDSKGGSLEPRR